MSDMTKVVSVTFPAILHLLVLPVPTAVIVVMVVMGNKDAIEMIPFLNWWVQCANIGHSIHLTHVDRLEQWGRVERSEEGVLSDRGD